MQVLNSSVARPWKLEQNTSGQASRQALRASRLWKLEQNNMTKKGPFFGPQNVEKAGAQKWASPVTIAYSKNLQVFSCRRSIVNIWVWALYLLPKKSTGIIIKPSYFKIADNITDPAQSSRITKIAPRGCARLQVVRRTTFGYIFNMLLLNHGVFNRQFIIAKYFVNMHRLRSIAPTFSGAKLRCLTTDNVSSWARSFLVFALSKGR